jgi:hypothetical protein
MFDAPAARAEITAEIIGRKVIFDLLHDFGFWRKGSVVRQKRTRRRLPAIEASVSPIPIRKFEDLANAPIRRRQRLARSNATGHVSLKELRDADREAGQNVGKDQFGDCIEYLSWPLGGENTDGFVLVFNDADVFDAGFQILRDFRHQRRPTVARRPHFEYDFRNLFDILSSWDRAFGSALVTEKSDIGSADRIRTALGTDWRLAHNSANIVIAKKEAQGEIDIRTNRPVTREWEIHLDNSPPHELRWLSAVGQFAIFFRSQ